jgi:type I restriction enzyme M protein
MLDTLGEIGDIILAIKQGHNLLDMLIGQPVKWMGSDDPTLINNERFAPAGVLAPIRPLIYPRWRHS